MTYTEKIVLASSEYFQNCMVEDPKGYIYAVLYIPYFGWITYLTSEFIFVLDRFDYK